MPTPGEPPCRPMPPRPCRSTTPPPPRRSPTTPSRSAPASPPWSPATAPSWRPATPGSPSSRRRSNTSAPRPRRRSCRGPDPMGEPDIDDIAFAAVSGGSEVPNPGDPPLVGPTKEADPDPDPDPGPEPEPIDVEALRGQIDALTRRLKDL